MSKIGVTRSPDKEVIRQLEPVHDKEAPTGSEDNADHDKRSSSPSLLAAMKAVYWKFGPSQWRYEPALRAWHKFLDRADLDAYGVPEKRLKAMYDCGPFGVKKTTNHFACNQTRLCPFCYGRRIVMPMTNASLKFLARNVHVPMSLASYSVPVKVVRLDAPGIEYDDIAPGIDTAIAFSSLWRARKRLQVESAMTTIVFGTRAQPDARKSNDRRASFDARIVALFGMPTEAAEAEAKRMKEVVDGSERFEVFDDGKLPGFIGRALAFDKTIYAVPPDVLMTAVDAAAGKRLTRSDGHFYGKQR